MRASRFFIVAAAVAVPAMAQERTVTIMATPIGEAPEWVREAWIGVTLPYRSMGICDTGILSGRRVPAFMSYLVDWDAAMGALARHSPEAVEWWRANTPWLPGFCFDDPNVA